MATILIIDDEPILLSNMATMLEYEDFQVIVSTNGAEALAMLAEKSVDLILCDMLMSPMNGFEILQAIQQTPHIAHIPFVFVTGVRWDETEADVTGVSGYLIKPFTREALLEVIQAQLG